MTHHLDAHGNEHAWHDNHVAAGYHLKKWSVPTPDAGAIGVYDLSDGSVLEISFLARGTLGPAELHLDFIDGPQLTVLDEATAVEYLALHGATKRQ